MRENKMKFNPNRMKIPLVNRKLGEGIGVQLVLDRLAFSPAKRGPQPRMQFDPQP